LRVAFLLGLFDLVVEVTGSLLVELGVLVVVVLGCV